MKFRVIPSILTNGNTVVKGTNFDNWRTVGSAQATALLYGSRNVDELMFLDVAATQQNRTIDTNLIQYFSNVLKIPFSVGGGIKTLEDAATCMRAGAEKIVLGTSAVETPALISEVALNFGSQAVTVAIDVISPEKKSILTRSGTREHNINPVEFAKRLVSYGAGEILLQSKFHDGLMNGMWHTLITEIVESVDVPIIASSGASKLSDFSDCYNLGASAIAAGAFFQFTEFTPQDVRNYLQSKNIPTRLI
jgi:cyclase